MRNFNRLRAELAPPGFDPKPPSHSLMSIPYAAELETALKAVRLASQVCRNVQSRITPEVLEKKDKSPVTVADFASQAVICRTLADAFPNDPIIAEEDSAELRTGAQTPFRDRIAADVHSVGLTGTSDDICDWIDRGRTTTFAPRFWTLDPIDGTKGFVRREQYAVALALIVNGQIEVGVLGCPNLPVTPGSETRGVLFAAVRGQGAFAIPLDGEATRSRLSVRRTNDPKDAVICESVESGHSDHDVSAQIARSLGVTAKSVRMDSQAKYAAVARGEADVYLRLPTRADYREKIWDHAAGVLVVEEAGGKVTDVAGHPLDWTHGQSLATNRGVIVTHPALHAAVLKAVIDAGVN